MQLSEVIVHNQHCLSSSARVLEVPVAPCVKHHEANWTFERQQRDNERWLLSLTKWNSIIGMQNRCHRFPPPGIFINLYRISRWLAWTSLVTFQCSSANYAGGSQRPNTWVMKSLNVLCCPVGRCVWRLSDILSHADFFVPQVELMEVLRPSVQRQGRKIDGPLSFMYHCFPLLNKNARPSKTVSCSNEPTCCCAMR